MNEDYNVSQCPVCESQGMSLGTLGNLEWYRCRGCGIEFNLEARQATQEELEETNRIIHVHVGEPH